MRTYDLLAIDLDGTLLDGKGEVSARNAAAIAQARDAGMEIVLATGRAWVESRHVVEQVGHGDGVFIGAGGAVLNRARDGETIWRSVMPGHLIERIVSAILSRGHLAHLLKDRHETGYDYLVVGSGVLDPATEWWFRTLPVAAKYSATLDGDDSAGETLRCGTVAGEREVADVAAAIRDELGDAIFMQHWPAVTGSSTGWAATHMLELFNPNVDKWTALERYASERGILAERIAAIGDGINDVRMIHSAGLGIAMANAVPAVTHVAARIAGHHEQDGVAEAIAAILAGQW